MKDGKKGQGKGRRKGPTSKARGGEGGRKGDGGLAPKAKNQSSPMFV